MPRSQARGGWRPGPVSATEEGDRERCCRSVVLSPLVDIMYLIGDFWRGWAGRVVGATAIIRRVAMQGSTRRRRVIAPVVGLLLLALGAGVAVGIGQSLGISYHRAEQMQPPAPEVPVVAPTAVNPRLVVRAPRTVRLRVAVEELRDAQRQNQTHGSATLTVQVGRSTDAQDDTYRLGGTPGSMTIRASGETGAVRGVYDLARAARSGRSGDRGPRTHGLQPAAVPDGRPGRRRRHAGPGAVALGHRLLPRLPGLRERLPADRAVRRPSARSPPTSATGRRSCASRSPTGTTPWRGPGSSSTPTSRAHPTARSTAPATRTSPGRRRCARPSRPFWERARELGVKVYLRTDMLALTPALKRYFERDASAASRPPTRGCGGSTPRRSTSSTARRRGCPGC